MVERVTGCSNYKCEINRLSHWVALGLHVPQSNRTIAYLLVDLLKSAYFVTLANCDRVAPTVCDLVPSVLLHTVEPQNYRST